MQPCELSRQQCWQRIEVHGIGRHAVKRAMWPAPIVEVDVSANASLGVGHRVVGVQVDLFVLDRLPQSFHEDVVAPRALAVHADRDVVLLGRPLNSALVNWLPWSVLTISGLPYFAIASSTASIQKSVFMLTDSRQARTRRVAQSATAARYTKSRRIGM